MKIVNLILSFIMLIFTQQIYAVGTDAAQQSLSPTPYIDSLTAQNGHSLNDGVYQTNPMSAYDNLPQLLAQTEVDNQIDATTETDVQVENVVAEEDTQVKIVVAEEPQEDVVEEVEETEESSSLDISDKTAFGILLGLILGIITIVAGSGG